VIDPPPAGPPDPSDEERVPIFGTWPRIYAAVIAANVAVIALVWAFSLWPW
jgi:hypothetical protein